MKMNDYQDMVDQILSMEGPWVSVYELAVRTHLTRREIRQIASERGYAGSNNGIAKLDRLTPSEQEHAFNRIRSQAMSMLRRCKLMKQIIEENTGKQLELPW